MSVPIKDPSESVAEKRQLSGEHSLATVDSSDVVDIRSLILTILRMWWLILLIGALGFANGLWNMHKFTPKYTATAIVAPLKGSNSSQSGGSVAAAVAGALTGVQIGGEASATPFDRLVHAAGSITLARLLDKKYGLLEEIFGKVAVAENPEAFGPSGFRAEFRESINRFLNLRTWAPPTVEDLASYFGGSFKVKKIPDSPFTQISFSHGKSEKALHYLNLIFNEATDLLKQKDRIEISKRQAYLEERLANTSLRDLREGLIGLMAGEARREMLMHGDLPFAAKIIEPAYLSKHKTQPNFLISVGAPTFVSMAIVVVLIMLFVLLRRE